MNAYYESLRRMKAVLLGMEDVNTVTRGNITEVDLSKTTIFPLAHISITGTRFPTNDALLVFQVTVAALGLRNTYIKPKPDDFIDSDNEDDNLNAQLYVLHDFYRRIKNLSDDFEILGEPNSEAVTEDYGNLLDGWIMTFELRVPSAGLDEIDIPDCDDR
jgi:hypothetical protein